MVDSVVTRKRRALQKLWSMFDQHLFAFKTIVVAVSGGPDSRALLEALAHWPGRLTRKFIIATIDHGQRSESSEESLYIMRRAKRLGFDFCSEVLPSFIETYSEQTLRDLRYKALSNIARRFNCQVICTAHHRDDDAEGFLMALMGLGGGELGKAMNEVEHFPDFTLVRPFLSLTKKELFLSLSFLQVTDVVVDRLDEAKIGERAFIRHEIVPHLQKKTLKLNQRLAFFGKIQQQNAQIIATMAESLIIWQKEGALIHYDDKTHSQLIVYALWQILKKLSNGNDLRASQATIDKIIEDLSPNLRKNASVKPTGLDRASNGFNLKPLNRKEYQFPGVLIIKDSGSIIAKCVV